MEIVCPAFPVRGGVRRKQTGHSGTGSPCPVVFFLQRLQVLDQVALLLAVQPESEVDVVMLDDVPQSCKAPVVEEAAPLVRPQCRQRCGAVHVGRRAVGLKGIDPHLLGRVQVVPRFRIQRRNVAGRAFALAVEDLLASCRGKEVFDSQGKCATCHVPPLYTEPGHNLHTPEEMRVDSFQADRSPTHMYRTAPLAGLWTHQRGGFYHDGRFATLRDVIEHYDVNFRLGLNGREKTDLIEYLKSL